jgi:hypothetical protein
MTISGRSLLILGGVLNFATATLHVAIPFVGVSAYVYFGAADLARLAAQGSTVPALITFMLALVFAGIGLYALSGAGVIRRLPMLRQGLLFVGSVHTLRGMILVLDLLRLARGLNYPIRQTFFSAVALAIGLLYLVGTARRWQSLRA